MDRSREARRAAAMAASTNGIPRRRHRTTNLRDSPEEDGPGEIQEPGRLRDRGLKRDRDRASGRSKRRRNEDESSEESVNDDVEDDEEDGGAVRMLPPHPAVTNHGHGHGHSQQLQQHVSRIKGVPGSTGVNNKAFRPVQGWKPADEMIGFSVPRKARSASKRSHENWVSGAGATPEQAHRQASPSPSPAPISPSSSNVSVRKKLKPNGSKQKPPKLSSKASSSNPEELEIEIAEVLYGLMTQSHAPPKREIESMVKFDPSRPNDESKSRVSSPISNSASTAPQLPQNSSSSTVPFSAVAPKRKKPRQVSENPSSLSTRNNPISSTMVKSEIDQPPKIENLLPNPEKTPISVSETSNLQSLSLNFAGLDNPAKELPAAAGSSEKETLAVKLEDSHGDVAVTKVNSTSSMLVIQREEKSGIDLMAPPPQLKSSPERESDIDFDAEMRKDEKSGKSGRDEMLVEEPESKKAKSVPELAESEKATMIKERNIDLQLDLEKPDRDTTESLSGNSKSHPHVQKQQQPQVRVAKDEHPHTEKAAQTSSLPLPISLASWPGGLPSMGYMAPLQGVVSMDGSQVPTNPVQPLFSQPRPKRCATHCYIARNIHYLQQFMKMNPFWPAPAGPASLFGAKPCNPNGVPSTELHGRAISSVQDKGPGLAIFPGHAGKEKASQPAIITDAQRKQPQILLQQALPAGAPPSNMLHGPAFIFPFNQQQAAAAVAATSIRPGPVKSSSTAPNSAPISASTSASVNGSASAAPTPAAVSFNYPNMPSNEPQYLAILQNNTYPFPIPAPTYRGVHPQPMPFFSGSFYTSQMIHPSQLQQPPSSQQQIQPGQQNASISNGSSSSQKQHLQGQQQRPEQGTGNLNTFPAPKTRPAQSSQPLQARNVETEAANQDSSSTADSRSSRGPVSVHGQNFSMPIHHQNFALVSSTQALSGTSNSNNTQGENKKQQSQHQGLKSGGAESLPTTFAMSFASMNSGNTAAGGIDLSSVAQNHAVFQNVSEADRRNYQFKQAAVAAQAAQQKKNFRVLEEGKNIVGGDLSNMDEEKKGLAPKASVTSGQSIAFTRPDLTDPSVSPLTGTNVVDSSARNMNMASSANNHQRGSRNSITNTSQMGQLQNVQFQQQQQHIHQQMVQFQKQQQQLQQQLVAARNNKTPHTSNGSTYGDHLATSSPSAGSKFPNSISGFPQNLVQSGGSNSPSHSPQWKASARGTPQVQSSSTSSLKSLPQQQQARPQQSHTQISFGSGQKPQTVPHGQLPSTHQSSSPPMGVGSPTTSLSKGAGGSPRTPSSNSQSNKASSLSSQQTKNPSSAPTLKTPSILGNPHNITSSNSGTKSLIQQQQQQHQLKQMANNQPQLFFSPAYMQTQPPQSTSNPANTSGYYLQRRYPEKQQQQQQQGGSPSGTSTGMLSLCTPVTVTNSSTTEAKAGAGTVSGNAKGPSQSILHQSQFQAQSSGNFSYVHSAPVGVQVKPTTEQKQPAGNREPVTRK